MGPGFRVAQTGGGIMKDPWDIEDEDIDAGEILDEDDWPESSWAIPDMTAVTVQAAEPVTNQVSARFMVVAWAVIIPALLGTLAGLWIGTSGGRRHAAPHPTPFSCASILAAGQGAAIYPLCNQWQATP